MTFVFLSCQYVYVLRGSFNKSCDSHILGIVNIDFVTSVCSAASQKQI